MDTIQTVDLIYRFDGQPGQSLLAVSGDVVAIGTAPRLVAGDCIKLRVFFADSAGEAVELAAGCAVYFGGQLADDMDGTLMCQATGFTRVPQAGAVDEHWTALLDLGWGVLIDAFGDETELTLRCDLEVQDADNTRRRTFQEDFPIRKQALVTAGAASVPAGIAFVEEGGALVLKFNGVVVASWSLP